MAKPRTIGNMIAPPRFLIFIALLIVSIPLSYQALARWTGAAVDHPELHRLALAAMAGFDIAAIVFLLSCISLLGTREAGEIREHAQQNDANRHVLLIVTGVVIGILLIAIAAEAVGQNPQPLTKVLIIGTLAIAWLFSNMVYALHYAHLAYMTPDGKCSGFDFPGTGEPDYWDFVYFAFTCGMAFATSDVQIANKHVRRVVTVHCLAAFGFNIGVLAFTINVLGSS